MILFIDTETSGTPKNGDKISAMVGSINTGEDWVANVDLTEVKHEPN